jgi:hypothetical protein
MIGQWKQIFLKGNFVAEGNPETFVFLGFLSYLVKLICTMKFSKKDPFGVGWNVNLTACDNFYEYVFTVLQFEFGLFNSRCCRQEIEKGQVKARLLVSGYPIYVPAI